MPQNQYVVPSCSSVEVGQRRCRPPCRRRDRSRWPWSVLLRWVLPGSIRRGSGSAAGDGVRSATMATDDRDRPTARRARSRARPPSRPSSREGIVGARPDDLRLAGRGGEPGLRAAARPRPARRATSSTSPRSTRRSRGSTTGPSAPCASCGRPIAPERLEALPWAAHCIDCQRTVDRARDDRRRPTPAARRHRRRSAPPRRRLDGVAVRTPLVAVRPRRTAAASSRPRASSRSARSRSAAPTSPSRRSPPDERARGVITYSSGNHAQGVARAARLLGAPAVVVMPSDAPRDQARAGRGGRRRDRRRRHRPATSARRSPSAIAAERGLAIIPPFDDDRIIAGQGTIGLEIVEDLPDVARRPRPDRRRRAGERRRDGGPGARAGGPGHRRRAGAGRRRARLAGGRRDRPLAGRARLADDRRRDADPGARPADVRPPVARCSTRSSR